MTLLQRDPPDIDERAYAALAELQELVSRHYPDASFRIERGIDAPESIHLVVTVDADFDDVLDHVIDRMMEIQIKGELPIFVIPVQPEVKALRSR
jgi:hypothetical protein